VTRTWPRAARAITLLAVLSIILAVATPGTPGDARPDRWKTGDVVCLNGSSMRSKAVRLLQGHSTDFSHVGIVVVENGVPFIVHADPSAGLVIMQRWDVVLRGGDIAGGAIYRYRHVSEHIRIIVSETALRLVRERVPFDKEFDQSNCSRLYCTELVVRAYAEAGVELRSQVGSARSHIFPIDLLEGGQLQLITRF
jgi:hypothetical protein